MSWQYHPIVVLFFLGGFVGLGVSLLAWVEIERRGRTPLVAAIGVLGVLNAIWAFAAALKTAHTDLGPTLFYYKLEFLGSAVVPSLAIVIALAFVGWERLVTRRLLAGLAAVPAVVVPLVILNPEGLMITNPTLVPTQGILAFEHDFPPAFALFLAWALGTASLAAGIIALQAWRGRVPRRQATVAVILFAVPVCTVSLKLGGIYPPGGDGINVTPAVNAFVLGLLALSITRDRLFELLPVARDRVVEVMPDGYVLLDESGRTLDANPAARDLLTEDLDDGSRLRALDALERTDDAANDDVENRAGVRTQVVAGDRTIEVRSTPVTRDDTSAGQVLLLRDVTEREDRIDRLERTNERLEQFASVISHDLRNPLNVASGRVDMAAEPGDENLDRARSALDRMNELIEDVLTLARQGGPVAETEPVSLDTVARGCWANVETADASLSVADGVTVQADRDRLRRLLENLFGNAAEHAGQEADVWVEPMEEGFAVADDGPGVPPEERARMFDSGYSTAEEGTGFGLAIVRGICDAHGWDIALTASEAGGARFEVTGVDIEV